MSFTPKAWENEPFPLLVLEGKAEPTSETPLDAEGLIDLEERLSAYTDTQGGLLIPKGLVDAKGDLLAGTADNTVARKAVGPDGSALLGDSGEGDGLRWGTPKGVSINCRLASTEALAGSRSGNVMTANANGAMPKVDNVEPKVGDYVLEGVHGTGSNRGVYKVTSLGSGGAKWTMERVPEMDTSAETIPGMLVTVSEGKANEGTTWQLVTPAPITLNTTSLAFSLVGKKNPVNSTGEDLKVIRGTLNTAGAGTIVVGSDFTIESRPGTGEVKLKFTAAFSAVPSVTTGSNSTLRTVGHAVTASVLTVGLAASGVAQDGIFSFIAAGPR